VGAPQELVLIEEVQQDSHPSRRERLLSAAVYLGAAALTVLATFVVLQLWRADPRVAFEYGSDTLSYHMVVKAVMEHPWYFTNPLLGMPAGFESHEFPFVVGDGFHLLVCKFLGLFTSNSVLVFNLYFLLGFPLTTLTTVLALRKLGSTYPSAIAAGVLFAFLPFHTMRQEIHIFMATYYAVPLMVLVLVWLGEPAPLFSRATRRRALASVAICALVAGTGLYQAFFAGVLLVVSGAVATLRHRSYRHALATVALLATLGGALGLAALPVIVHQRSAGPNPAVAQRPFRDSEVYGLKIGYLVLPRKDHRFEPLNALTKPLYAGLPLEGVSASLGTFGTVGFLALLGLMFKRSRRSPSSVSDRLAEANLGAVLFATIGGFSVLFAAFVTPQFRAHNRILIYIGCFGFFAVALALDWARRRWGFRWHLVAVAAVILIGVWDQTSEANVRDYANAARAYRSDAELVKRIEGSVRPGAMIFQLPYVRFPEGGYDLLRPYFHSSSLRWSFPTMYGRPTAAWQQTIAARPLPEMVDQLTAAGFEGILVHRFLLPGSAQVEADLTRLLGQGPLVSNDRHFFFFRLSGRRAP
jgi:phosphoglycerol transferase